MLAAPRSCSLPAPARAQTYVTFPDPNLEAVVRGALNIPAGPLTAEDLQTLIYLYAGGAQITNLSGLEYATNLMTLTLQYNAVSDVSPLAGLAEPGVSESGRK